MRRFLVLAVVAALAACGRDEVFPRGNGPGGGGQGGGTAGGFGGGSAGGQGGGTAGGFGGGTAGGFGGGTAGGFGGGSAGGQGGGTAGGFGGGSAGGQGGGTAGGSGGGGSAGGQGGGGMSIDTPCSEPVAAPTLLALRASMVGTWRGKQVSPWQAPQQVEFTFRANGTYSARNLNSAGGPALYYGTDADSATKTYQVTDLHTNGDGKGTIRVVFSVGQMGNVGTLDVIRVCDVSRRLDFEFYPSWLGMIGPVEFRLARFP